LSDAEVVYRLEALPRIVPKIAKTLFLSGISGVGKSTIAMELEKLGYQKVVNVTTRPRRTSERAEDYVFVTPEEFVHLETAGALFYPHARNGVWHAIMRSDIERLVHSTSLFYMDKSLASLAKIYSAYPDLKTNAVSVYILPPSLQILYERISAREASLAGSTGMSETAIFQRFEEEIADLKLANEIGSVFIVNDEVGRVVKEVKTLLSLPQSSS
jgi:guanylate kinase